ncbi:MAG: hypothetical protein SF339_21210, partial [Blastocatellia bacterium]|nr:hypothetical protein [Blastocatellia bacterium]
MRIGKYLLGICLAVTALAMFSARAQEQQPQQRREERADPMSTGTFGGLRFRAIGPAVTGGRVVDFAVDPNNRAKYFAAVASGGVWKTINGGTTWTPVFDNYGSFSI